ncbi:unnamed protein product [Candidula unifasciata]|uniref:U-box domain containing 5 n=1 Tax=Candidula unifasciata TaxID=100452 RepID=A0A8S4A2W9_9EUPU|nr:unnamed protein product [Candidula unifasciata]
MHQLQQPAISTFGVCRHHLLQSASEMTLLINTLHFYISHPVTEVEVKHKQTVASTATPTTSSVAEECQELDIPEDFLDPITCEVMAVPMLLPCGKNVDQSTLDHYFSVEATYGRQPRDPFTGVQFSSTNRPVPNGALKGRIDKFLMEHSNDTATFKIARTVGTGLNSSLLGKRKHSGHVRGISSVVLKSPGMQPSHASSDDQVNVSTTKVTRKPPEQQECHQVKTIPKSSGLGQSDHAKSHKESQMSGKRQVISLAASCSNQVEHSPGYSHETQLKNSLNSALSSILSCLPSYPLLLQSTTDNYSCFLCNRALSDQVSYVTPCHHYMCRDCLTSDSITSSVTCRVCQHNFTKRDVLRRHHVT